MKNFNFSLDKVLGYREQILELEKNNLALEIVKENNLTAAIEKTQKDIDEQADILKQRMDAGTTTMVIRQISNQIESLKNNLKIQKYHLQEQQKAVQKQRNVVVKANQDHSLLEKLKEKKLDEYRLESIKQENERVEELIVTGLVRQGEHSPLSK